MKNIDQIVERIKKTTQNYPPDTVVLLVGSHARNEASSESDYDILLITETNLSPKEILLLRTRIRKSLLLIAILPKYRFLEIWKMKFQISMFI
jgi:predicted nucleotidyltransferase